MAVPLYQIGAYRFLTLHGQPVLPEHEVIVDMRPGVDGLQFTQTGMRGKPFSMLSRIDVPSYLFGMQYFSIQYQVTPVLGLLDFVVNDFEYNSINLKVEVINVRLGPRGCFRAFPIVGGLTAGSTHLLEAEWELALLTNPAS